jgi:hypothetical protein
MNRYTFVRSSVFEETFTVEAESEAEALDLVQDGAPSVEIKDHKGWIDWHDEEYSLETVEDDVVRFLNSKELA